MRVAGQLRSTLEVASNVGGVSTLLLADGGNGLPAHRVLGNAVCNGLSVDKVGIVVQIRDVIANQVVVDIVGDTNFSTEELSLLLSLEPLSASEQTTYGAPLI